MRICELTVREFKGLGVEQLRWAPAVVLFGPNDAGKTNLIEALAVAFADRFDVRRDPLTGSEVLDLEVLLELDGLDEPGGEDGAVLAAVLQVEHVPPLFPWWLGWRPVLPQRDLGNEEELRTRLEIGWVDDSGEEAELGFKLPIRGEIAPEFRSLDEVRRHMREEVLAHARARCADWEHAREDFEALVDACLTSRWLRYGSRTGPVWLTPRNAECRPDLAERARRLRDPRLWGSVPLLERFVELLIQGSDEQVAFLRIGTGAHDFSPFRFVRLDATSGQGAGLPSRVTEYVRAMLPQAEIDASNVDPWLEEVAEGAYAVSTAVAQACEALSDRANEIAPRFVRRDYRIVVEPLAPHVWYASGERVRVSLARDGAEDSFDLRIAGSGVATWATLAVEESMRRLAGERKRGHAVEHDDLGYSLVGRQKTLYLLDEPETHLHPLAQEEAARWIAEEAIANGAFVVLATHALPFLALPTEQVAYHRVRRDVEGMTRAIEITENVLPYLTEEVGISPAQRVQLIRGVMIVEGRDDECVLSNFFGSQLARDRIHILPLRGFHNALATAEAELLKLLRVPLVFLFDNVVAARVREAERTGRAKPPGHLSDEEKALFRLRLYWRPRRERPDFVDFPAPDIVCALPEQHVHEYLASNYGCRSFRGWESIEQAWKKKAERPNFKDFFVEHLRLEKAGKLVSSREFVNDLVKSCPSGLSPDPRLTRAVKQARATLTGPPPRSDDFQPPERSGRPRT